MKRRKGAGLVLRVAILLVVATSAGAVFAQASFPSKPLRMIFTYPPGGPADSVARHIAAKMGEGFGQNVMIDNRPGASGLIGLAEFAKANTDGYTLLFQLMTGAAIHPHLYKKVPFDWIKDFQPVARIVIVPNVLLINRDLPAKNLKDLIALAKARPGKLSYSSSGNGSLLHLSGALFAQQAGIDLLHVPYKGGAQALSDVVGGHVTMIFSNIPGLVGMIKAGQARAIAVTTGERLAALPDVPTMMESGLPKFQNASWFALYTRGGVPPAVLSKLEAEALRAINSPDTVARMVELGVVPGPMGAAQLDKFWKSEIEYWRPIVSSLDIKVDY